MVRVLRHAVVDMPKNFTAEIQDLRKNQKPRGISNVVETIRRAVSEDS